MELGRFQLSVVSDGTIRLDGGAMFGVVPRVVWENYSKPDEKNRILIGLNCLLVQTPEHNILIDTGMGEKWTEKEKEIYSITRPPSLLVSLESLGLRREDISIVINTHLHFDHAGGNTRLDSSPTFPNAIYYVQKDEYEHACNPHERDRASYRPADWENLVKNGQLVLVNGDQEIVPGVTVFRVPGHNLDTQLVKIESEGQTAVFFADIIPTTFHLPFAWVMGYDLYPVELLEQKKRLIPEAAKEGWLCVFEHDPIVPLGRIVQENGKFRVVRI